jgi:hypothetical protein
MPISENTFAGYHSGRPVNSDGIAEEKTGFNGRSERFV